MKTQFNARAGWLALALAVGLPPMAVLAQDQTQTQTQTRHTHTVCQDVEVRDSGDNHQITGTAVGAVAGGLLGHQVGSGKGKTLATVGGAVAGGYAGKKVQENHQDQNTHTVRRCHQVED